MRTLTFYSNMYGVTNPTCAHRAPNLVLPGDKAFPGAASRVYLGGTRGPDAPPGLTPGPLEKPHPPWQGQAIAAGECGRNYPLVLPTPSLPCSARKRSAFQTQDGSRVLNWLRRVIRAPGRTPPGLRASARVRLTLQMLTFPGKDVLSSLWSDPWGVGATGTRGARLPGTGEKGDPRCHEGASRGGSVPSTAVGSPPKWACQRGSPVGSIPGAGSASPQGSPGWGRTPILVAQTGQARDNKGTPRATGETPPGHVAAPASNHTGATYPSRAPRPKGEGARETKFKRGLGCQHRRQPTKKLPQCPSRPSIRPHPAPARFPPRPRPPEASRAPCRRPGEGGAGAGPVPQPRPRDCGLRGIHP